MEHWLEILSWFIVAFIIGAMMGNIYQDEIRMVFGQ